MFLSVLLNPCLRQSNAILKPFFCVTSPNKDYSFIKNKKINWICLKLVICHVTTESCKCTQSLLSPSGAQRLQRSHIKKENEKYTFQIHVLKPFCIFLHWKFFFWSKIQHYSVSQQGQDIAILLFYCQFIRRFYPGHDRNLHAPSIRLKWIWSTVSNPHTQKKE